MQDLTEGFITERNRPPKTVLLVGASRGIGLAMAAQFLSRGWNVIGTVRELGRNGLDDLADVYAERVRSEPLDITEPEQIADLRERLTSVDLDVLFVNAGTANDKPEQTIGEVSTEEFVRVMLTNVLGVMRAVEAFADLVTADGLLGVMSSGQGSIANNEGGGREVYRGSKAALNQSMRSFAARHPNDPRAMVLMAPGWIRTELGGPDAPFTIDETVPQLVDTLLAQLGTRGLRFIDRFGATVPW